MNWGFRTPLSVSRRESLQVATTVPAPHRRRPMWLIAAFVAAVALAQATPALGAEASIVNTTVAEGNSGSTIATITIALTGGTAASGDSVDVATVAGGTATAGTDFTSITPAQTVPFTAGASSATFQVLIAGDTTVEPDETVLLELSNPVGTITLPLLPQQGTLTIGNDDPQISITDSAVFEGDAGSINATFIVSLTAASTVSIDVTYAVVAGTATAGTDYTTNSPGSPITFAPGDTSVVVSVSVAGDLLDEGDETFFVNLSNPTGGATIADGQGLGTITDDDVTHFTINNPAATLEVNAPATSTTTFTITRDRPSDHTVTVNYATGPDTPLSAIAGTDYTAIASTPLAFAAADPLTKTIDVTITGDALDENTETYLVNLTATAGTTAAGPGTGTITDDDPPPTISIAPVTVTEGTTVPPDPTTTPAAFNVTLSAPSGLDITATYSTADGTAVAGSDYTAATGVTLTILAGTTTGTITIPVIPDNVDELATESFTVSFGTLTNATLATPGDGIATGTITDDDIAVASITPLAPSFTEGTSPPATTAATFTVTLSNPSDRQITVRYHTAAGSLTPATAGTDYTAIANLAANAVTFPIGNQSQQFTVTLTADNIDENDETFLANISDPTGGATIHPIANQATATIIDDDALPFIRFQVPSTETQLEGNSGVTIKNIVIQLTDANGTSIPSGRDVSVTWETADIPEFAPNGTPNVDYGAVAPTTVVFAPGDITKALPVSIIGDINAAESSESVGLRLTSPINAEPIASPTKQLLILEDDTPNQPPFPNIDVLTVARNAFGTVNVRANDTDPNGDAMFVPDNTNGAHGIATCRSTGVCVYTPTPGYAGPDSFTYTLSDGQATTLGTVNVTVVNAAPIANADALVTAQGAPGAVNVLANDTDPDGGALTIASATSAVHGIVACGAGVCNYVPAAGFGGADQFTYTASDPDGATAVGTVNVTVARGQPLTIAATVNGARARRGLKRMYTIIFRNPNAGPVTLTSASVCLPKGFAYVARSVTGPLKKVPLKRSCGKGKTKLMWVKKVRIRGKGAVALRFKVTVRGPLTTAKITATAKVAAGFTVKPLKAGAPVKVVAK